MTDVTRILNAIEQGDPHAASQLLPLVYAELRKLAAEKLAQEKPGQTLEATALVHEAYLRLVGSSQEPHWNGRGHFFAAAAQAMRNILVDSARRKRRAKHGGGRHRVTLDEALPAPPDDADELLALDEALSRLAAEDPEAGRIVQLRYFAGLSVEEAAQAEESYRQAVTLGEELRAESPDDPATLDKLADTHRELGVFYWDTVRWPQAEETMKQGVAPREQLERRDPAYPENRSSLAGLHNNLVALYRTMGQLDQAEAAFQKCKALMEALLSRDAKNPRYLSILGACHQNMALVYGAKDRIAEAEAANQKGVDLFQQPRQGRGRLSAIPRPP